MEESDLKPPEGLFKKPLSMAGSAFSKMMLRAQQYDLVVQCSPYQAVTGKIYRLKQHFLLPATA